MTRKIAGGALALLLLGAASGSGQYPPGKQGSPNVHILSHIPLGRVVSVGDIEIEQEMSRPYAYVARINGSVHAAGFHIIHLKDPARARMIYHWRIENPELHEGLGTSDVAYFKLNGRYYYVNPMQFAPTGPDGNLAAVVFDVTGLPDTSRIREARRLRLPATPGGSHNVFPYKHSDGRVLMFTVTQSAYAHIYDMARFLAGDADNGLVGRVPNPDSVFSVTRYGRAFHDFYAGYDPASHQDKLYAAGYAGYYIFDVSDPANPKLLTSVTGVAGLDHGHTFTPTPDGRYAVGESEEQYQPLRIFDLKPGLDGQVKTISRPIGAWTANWQNLSHNHEVRWPYVFVAAMEDGLHVFNMMDPTNPYTVGYYDTWDGPHFKLGYSLGRNPEDGNSIFNGAWGVDVRNADGLVVVSDFSTGFWAFKMDGFDGWNGHQWGMPNVSSAQDWDNGPEGAPAVRKVS